MAEVKQGPKRSKKAKRPDKRPARLRYWAKRTLEKRKVRRLMRQGLSEPNAVAIWRAQRKGRVPDGFLGRKTDGKDQ